MCDRRAFVVFGETWPAIWACSREIRPFDRYAVIPVARNVCNSGSRAGSPAAAGRLIMASTTRCVNARAVRLSPARGLGGPVVSRYVVPGTFSTASGPASTITLRELEARPAPVCADRRHHGRRD